MAWRDWLPYGRAAPTAQIAGPSGGPSDVRGRLDALLSPGDRAKLESRLDALENGGWHVDSAAVANLLTGLGGDQDKGAAARPHLGRLRLTDTELTSLYLNGGIAQRILRLVPIEMTRKGWTINDDLEDPDALADTDKRLKTRQNIRDVVTWARTYGSAVILMVTEEEQPRTIGARAEVRRDPSRLLLEPLDPRRLTRVRALQVFDALEATPLVYQGDISEPGYRDPLIWNLSPSAVGVSMTHSPHAQVHASRILHFRGVPRPPSFRLGGIRGSLSVAGNNALDDSVLHAVWDEVRNLAQTMAGGAVLAQEIRENVLKVGGLRAMATSDQKKEVEARISFIAMAKSLLGIVLLGQDDEFTSKVNNPTGFGELSGEAQAMLSAATGIPQTILFGHTPAGLSTDNESGRQTFDRLISGEQEEIRPHLERVYSLIFASKEGPTKGEIPETWELDFLPLDEMSEKEKADTRKVVADADILYIDRGVVSPQRIEESRFGEKGYQIELLPPEDDIDGVDFDLAAAEAEEAGGGVVEPEGATTGAAVGAAGAAGAEGAVAPPTAGGAPVIGGTGGAVATRAEKFADVALNGAQIAQAVDIVVKIGTGEIPRDSGVASISILFNLSTEAAEAIVGSAGTPRAPVVTTEQAAADAWERMRTWRGDQAEGEGEGGTDPRAAREALRGEEALWFSLQPTSNAAMVNVAALRTAAEDALGLALLDPPPPHVTLLFAGPVEADTDKDKAAIMTKATAAVQGVQGPVPLHVMGLDAFPVGPNGRSAVVVKLWADGVERLHTRLLRALAPHIVAPQFPEFVAHLTLGWLEGEADRAALAEVDVREALGDEGFGSSVLAAVDKVTAMRGGQVVAELPLGREA
jgi:phage-related protein (TIGR01555 family)